MITTDETLICLEFNIPCNGVAWCFCAHCKQWLDKPVEKVS